MAHAIIDGIIDTERTKAWTVSDQPDAKISPEGVSLFFGVAQDKSRMLINWADCGHVLVFAHPAPVSFHTRN